MSESNTNPSPLTFRVEKPLAEKLLPEPEKVVEEPKVEEPKVEVVQPEPVTKVEPVTKPTMAEVKPGVSETPIVDAMNKMKAQPKSKAPLVIGLVLAVLLGAGYLGTTDNFRPWINEIGTYITKSIKPAETVKKEVEKAAEKVKEADDDWIELPPALKVEKLPAAVLDARDYYLRLRNDDQTVTVRTGGSRSWRLANPCTILWGKFAKAQGAVGSADKYAVWLKHESGRKACYELLFESDHGYKELKVADAIRRYAPMKEGFKTDNYLKALRKARINDGHIMSDLNEARRQKLIDVLLDVEDYNPGRVIEYQSDKDFERRGY